MISCDYRRIKGELLYFLDHRRYGTKKFIGRETHFLRTCEKRTWKRKWKTRFIPDLIVLRSRRLGLKREKYQSDTSRRLCSFMSNFRVVDLLYFPHSPVYKISNNSVIASLVKVRYSSAWCLTMTFIISLFLILFCKYITLNESSCKFDLLHFVNCIRFFSYTYFNTFYFCVFWYG